MEYVQELMMLIVFNFFFSPKDFLEAGKDLHAVKDLKITLNLYFQNINGKQQEMDTPKITVMTLSLQIVKKTLARKVLLKMRDLINLTG